MVKLIQTLTNHFLATVYEVLGGFSNEVKTKMDKDFLVFDGRNVINKENLNSLGFKSYVIGQS